MNFQFPIFSLLIINPSKLIKKRIASAFLLKFIHLDKQTSVKSFSKWLQLQEQTESTKKERKEESYALKISNSKSYSGFIFGGKVGARSASPIPNRIPGFLRCCSVVAWFQERIGTRRMIRERWPSIRSARSLSTLLNETQLRHTHRMDISNRAFPAPFTVSRWTRRIIGELQTEFIQWV